MSTNSLEKVEFLGRKGKGKLIFNLQKPPDVVSIFNKNPTFQTGSVNSPPFVENLQKIVEEALHSYSAVLNESIEYLHTKKLKTCLSL